MQKNPLLISVMVLALLVAACGRKDTKSIRGSGNVINESRNVSGFTAVSLSGSGRLIIEQTGAESLTITAEDNILPLLTSEVRGSQLILGTRDNTSINTTKEFVYSLTVKNLNEIEISGSANVDAKGINTSQLKIVVSGSSDMTMSGKANRQDITISGSGNYQAQNLESKAVSITISGSGNAVVKVSETLDVQINGLGSVEYIGNPAVTQNVIGSGSLRKR